MSILDFRKYTLSIYDALFMSICPKSGNLDVKSDGSFDMLFIYDVFYGYGFVNNHSGRSSAYTLKISFNSQTNKCLLELIRTGNADNQPFSLKEIFDVKDLNTKFLKAKLGAYHLEEEYYTQHGNPRSVINPRLNKNLTRINYPDGSTKFFVDIVSYTIDFLRYTDLEFSLNIYAKDMFLRTKKGHLHINVVDGFKNVEDYQKQLKQDLKRLSTDSDSDTLKIYQFSDKKLADSAVNGMLTKVNFAKSANLQLDSILDAAGNKSIGFKFGDKPYHLIFKLKDKVLHVTPYFVWSESQVLFKNDTASPTIQDLLTFLGGSNLPPNLVSFIADYYNGRKSKSVLLQYFAK